MNQAFSQSVHYAIFFCSYPHLFAFLPPSSSYRQAFYTHKNRTTLRVHTNQNCNFKTTRVLFIFFVVPNFVRGFSRESCHILNTHEPWSRRKKLCVCVRKWCETIWWMYTYHTMIYPTTDPTWYSILSISLSVKVTFKNTYFVRFIFMAARARCGSVCVLRVFFFIFAFFLINYGESDGVSFVLRFRHLVCATDKNVVFPSEVPDFIY